MSDAADAPYRVEKKHGDAVCVIRGNRKLGRCGDNRVKLTLF